MKSNEILTLIEYKHQSISRDTHIESIILYNNLKLTKDGYILIISLSVLMILTVVVVYGESQTSRIDQGLNIDYTKCESLDYLTSTATYFGSQSNTIQGSSLKDSIYFSPNIPIKFEGPIDLLSKLATIDDPKCYVVECVGATVRFRYQSTREYFLVAIDSTLNNVSNVVNGVPTLFDGQFFVRVCSPKFSCLDQISNPELVIISKVISDEFSLGTCLTRGKRFNLTPGEVLSLSFTLTNTIVGILVLALRTVRIKKFNDISNESQKISSLITEINGLKDTLKSLTNQNLTISND